MSQESKLQCTGSVPLAPLHPKDHVYAAVCRMKESGQACLPVVEDGKLVGVVSDKDILDRCVMDAGSMAIPSLNVEDVMARDLACAHTGEPAIEALTQLLETKERFLPLEDEAGHIVDVLSLADVVGQCNLATRAARP